MSRRTGLAAQIGRAWERHLRRLVAWVASPPRERSDEDRAGPRDRGTLPGSGTPGRPPVAGDARVDR
ncbi:hypothetical protein ACQBAT_14835 [Ornithinimicrobium sp. Y1847]|uniref:hypothetical protein n=1 Tax=Ornithinimicrobium sp. Y1847 TaxID=3405419 RepID=UPI003B683E06